MDSAQISGSGAGDGQKHSDKQGTLSGSRKVDQKGQLGGHATQRQKRLRFQPESIKLDKKDAPRHEYFKELLDPESKSEVELPRAICVADRVESTAREMKAMLRAVSQHTSNRAVLQKIPRHMRRRAASHNRKRLPRRLHQLAAQMTAHSQTESGDKTAKPPSRKKRRRKMNLQNEYAKRAGKCGWLETHMWHAKRFHMSETNDPKYAKWGNRIALFPNDKSFRACHRAVAKHCLVQDISYMRCLRLCGHKGEIVQLFNDVCGVTFDPVVLEGRKEAKVIISKPMTDASENKGLKECIGPASVLWRPTIEGEQNEVLLWLHPAILVSTMDILTAHCKSKSLGITLSNVSDSLQRFRLTGPKSSVTLLSVLRPMNQSRSGDNEKSALGDWMTKNRDVVSQLHREFIDFATDCHRCIFARKGGAVACNDFTEPSDGSVFPVITNDPRLTLPLDKTTPSLTRAKEQLDNENNDENLELPEDGNLAEEDSYYEQTEVPCVSPLWVEGVQNEVSQSRKPDHVVSTRIHCLRYEVNEEKETEWRESLATAVPVIAIRKVPNEDKELSSSGEVCKTAHSGPDEKFASGWDLILPKNWATAFWIPLIYHRARAGGVRENRNASLEYLSPHFPQDFPDTRAGREFWVAEAKFLSTKYYRKPPAKRPNYSVLAVPNPFQPDWNGLFEEHVSEERGVILKRPHDITDEGSAPCKRLKVESSAPSDSANIEVLKTSSDGETRQAKGELINVIQDGIRPVIPVLRCQDQLVVIKQWIQKILIPETDESPQNLQDTDFQTCGKHLICVSIKALNKGIPFSRSMVCEPTSKDLDNLCEELTDPYKYGLQSVTGPTEEKHWDPYREERKEARKLSKKRKKIKEEVITSDEVPGDDGKTEDTLRAKQPQCFPVNPSTNVMGYVTSGDFVFSYACGAAVGFVAAEKLFTLAENQARHEKLRTILKDLNFRTMLLNGSSQVPLLALMRNTDSSQYRCVKLEVIKPS